ncbi:TOR signaling pathway regulator (TapA), putative [Talaromyces stipitatus ATCC 10500]|uniref:TOR signaling pathway regulator (TapA), putative n=1 Tax=Talaromyces stipitatus (strain ATCC 10500 / CBS 375.48 / QM 6759 / NRRL 1006) TaxID=441959 RepID=B8LY33_TALSN|nr:TOR signaling pathway regulator (TapA), putative [Talaromyces stipitatus ATCC 10500]EED23278.1 TOR signaling pathway regulator (TapA), putative [Talaromyces stipitatus ATCC 10500]
MTDQPQSLKELFQAAKEQKLSLETSAEPNSDAYRQQVSDTINKLQECQRLISQLSLFSSNEGLEDVSTANLQFLTVDHLLAEVVQRASSTDREAVLRRALGEYEKFLTRLDDYGLLSDRDKKLFEQYTENPARFSLALKNDAANRREVKVGRFREEKELKQKLEYFRQNENRLQSDDEATRKLYLAEINLYTHQTFQSLDMIAQELEMLSQMRHAPPVSAPQDDPRSRNTPDKNNYSERLDGPLSQLLQGGRGGPLLSKSGKPLQPFTLTNKRTELQQGVFRPGHNLPTMTIDEYLEEERRRGGILEGGTSNEVPEPDEDDLDKADEETMKARAWDEFKEDNPRGSGNTLNRG